MNKATFKNLSIRTKLALIALLTCTAAVALACAALFAYEVRSFKKRLVTDLHAQATMVSGLCYAALTFNESSAAFEVLGELKSQPHIRWAMIFRNGKVFASYKNPGEPAPLPEIAPVTLGAEYRPDGLHVSADIRFKGESLGTVYLSADTSQLRVRLWEYSKILLAVFLASSLIALLLASLLQRTIVRPVVRLAQAAQQVAGRQDYSVRVPAGGQDELGQLTSTFNLMLDRIQAQDAELREGRERFEVAVSGARDGIWDWNLQSGAMYLSPRSRSILGFGEDEPLQSHDTWLDNCCSGDDRAVAEAALAEYLAGQRAVFEVEYRMRHRDGTARWILDRGAVIRDASGKPQRMAGSHTDITERKQIAEQLARVQRELVEASRAAGKAEVATGVLHNVGNVLNSVNVSAALVVDQLRKSKTASLVRAVKMLRDQGGDVGRFLTEDPKGRQLPAFLEALATHLVEEQALMVRETQGLQQNIEHIKHIVAMQQSYAKAAGIKERVEVSELLEDAVRMAAPALARHRVEVVREFAPVPTVMVDRHLVLQILVNLVSNAKQALDARADGRRVTLRIGMTPEARVVAVEVADNGPGIAPENLTKVFQHGFTTKKNGHGFGLHSGANAAKEMGGRLTARSDGLGTGATFTLELPAVPAAPPASRTAPMPPPKMALHVNGSP